MKPLLFILTALIFGSCSTQKTTVKSNPVIQAKASQIIYKTKQDYSLHVPAQMNKERTKIVGFPAPSDLMVNGELQTPLKLKNGFFYDRRGVSSNTVFLKYTYKEYADLKTIPNIEDLEQSILEKYPFTAMYSCPQLRSDLEVEELNRFLDEGFLDCIEVIKIIE